MKRYEKHISLTLRHGKMRTFINDKAWSIKQANTNYGWTMWTQNVPKKPQEETAIRHLSSAQMYKAKGDGYTRPA